MYCAQHKQHTTVRPLAVARINTIQTSTLYSFIDYTKHVCLYFIESILRLSAAVRKTIISVSDSIHSHDKLFGMVFVPELTSATRTQREIQNSVPNFCKCAKNSLQKSQPCFTKHYNSFSIFVIELV